MLVFIFLGSVFMNCHATNTTCNSDGSCPTGEFCNANTNLCINANSTVMCGGWGAFLNCGLLGIITAECGSGKELDCSNKGGCGSDICEGASCSYPSLIPTFMGTTKWICGKYGTQLSCQDYNGSVLIGVCGAGKKEDCTQYCTGYHGILCAKSEYFNINWNNCTWTSGGYGEWINCKKGASLATGHCGSGENEDCPNKTVHQLQCCSLIYNITSSD
eukprot:70978_1